MNFKLDLSFNNIEKLEGLDNLTKLRDLSLYNNQISKLENMNLLGNLEVFSIGNNQITDYSNVSKNLKLKKLIFSNIIFKLWWILDSLS